MALKNLGMFNKFDFDSFSLGKKFLFLKVEDLLEKNNQDEMEVIGAKVFLLIAVDSTDYRGSEHSNEHETLVIKLPNKSKSNYSNMKSLASVVEVKGVERATVYGDWKNQLSITAEDVVGVVAK